MPMKRRIHKLRDDRVTPTVLAAYRRALELRALGADFREEAHEAEAMVDRLLGGGIRRLWLPGVFDVHIADPGDPAWEHAMALRRRLDQALSEAPPTLDRALSEASPVQPPGEGKNGRNRP
jgi:hypothetical protein